MWCGGFTVEFLLCSWEEGWPGLDWSGLVVGFGGLVVGFGGLWWAWVGFGGLWWALVSFGKGFCVAAKRWVLG